MINAPITVADVVDFDLLGAEVCFSHPRHGLFWLVAQVTGADRNEIESSDVLRLANVREAFGVTEPTKWRFKKREVKV